MDVRDNIYKLLSLKAESVFGVPRSEARKLLLKFSLEELEPIAMFMFVCEMQARREYATLEFLKKLGVEVDETKTPLNKRATLLREGKVDEFFEQFKKIAKSLENYKEPDAVALYEFIHKLRPDYEEFHNYFKKGHEKALKKAAEIGAKETGLPASNFLFKYGELHNLMAYVQEAWQKEGAKRFFEELGLGRQNG